ncbi:MAG: ANTAR domain-containing protein [Syntrophomonadaceae bacterium]|nr:ANTAR domain-containing protein [Syntrophomonadaceae bacterium]
MPKATIVIADGKASSRKALKELLTRSGYLVQAEAHNAPDLLRKARTVFPDIVIMDSGLEGGGIQEIADIITGDELSNVLVLVDGPHWRKLDNIPHIIKPYSEETLLSVIDICLLYQTRFNSMKSEVDKLRESLTVRKGIEKAKGILMKKHGIDEAEAYRSMQKESMNRGISMKDLARAIIAADENEKNIKER